MKVVTTSKAFEQLEKGKKIRCVSWDENEYLVFNSDGIMVEESGTPIDITIEKDMTWFILD